MGKRVWHRGRNAGRSYAATGDCALPSGRCGSSGITFKGDYTQSVCNDSAGM